MVDNGILLYTIVEAISHLNIKQKLYHQPNMVSDMMAKIRNMDKNDDITC